MEFQIYKMYIFERSIMDDYLEYYFCNPKNTEFAQLVSAFLISLILSPWSWGFYYFFGFLIIYEFICIIGTQCREPYWRLGFRISVILASMLGWIIGRIIFGYKDPFHSKKRNEKRT